MSLFGVDSLPVLLITTCDRWRNLLMLLLLSTKKNLVSEFWSFISYAEQYTGFSDSEWHVYLFIKPDTLVAGLHLLTRVQSSTTKVDLRKIVLGRIRGLKCDHGLSVWITWLHLTYLMNLAIREISIPTIHAIEICSVRFLQKQQNIRVPLGSMVLISAIPYRWT